MELPKILFRAMTFKENMNMMAKFIKQEIRRKQKPNIDFFKNHYIEISTINFTKDMNEEQISKLLQSILLDSWNKDMENAEQKIKDMQNNWDLINDNVMLDLSKRLNIEWPKDALDIQARVGIMFFCPRYINQRTFDIKINVNINRMRTIVIHEITHFLYFEKWKELFNDYDERNYNSPSIAWYLSEAIIDPLLNNDIFVKYTNQEINSNKDICETKINGQSIVHTLREIINNNSIEDGIKLGYDYFVEHEEIIKGSTFP